MCTATYTTLCALGVCTPFLGSLRAFLDSRACKCDGHVQLQPKALTTVPTSSPPAALSVGGGAGGGVVVGVEGPPTAPESAAFGVVFADYCCSLYAGYHAVELSPVRDLVTLFQPGYLAPRAVLAVTLARADEGKARFPQQVRAAVRAAIQASAMTGGSWEREGVDDGEGFGNGVGADDKVGGADKDGEDDFGGGDRSDKDGEGKEDGRDGEGYVGAEGAEDGELPSMGGEEEGDQDDANVLCAAVAALASHAGFECTLCDAFDYTGTFVRVWTLTAAAKASALVDHGDSVDVDDDAADDYDDDDDDDDDDDAATTVAVRAADAGDVAPWVVAGGQMAVHLAPMAAVTDRHFRMLIRIVSRSVVLWSEMTWDRAIVEAAATSPAALEAIIGFSEAEHPVVLQLGGCEPELLARAAAIGVARGYDEINLNCGCPAGTRGAMQACYGARLMLEPARVAACCAAMREAVGGRVPITVKCRLGVDGRGTFVDLVEFLTVVARDGGVRTFVLHARHAMLGLNAAQNRAVPPLRYDWLPRLVRELPPELPLSIVLNGGVTSGVHATQLLSQAAAARATSTDATVGAATGGVMGGSATIIGVMIGRRAIAEPYVFASLQPAGQRPPSRREVLHAYLGYASAAQRANWGGTQYPETLVRVLLSPLGGVLHDTPYAGRWRRALTRAMQERELLRQSDSVRVVVKRCLDACGPAVAELLDRPGHAQSPPPAARPAPPPATPAPLPGVPSSAFPSPPAVFTPPPVDFTPPPAASLASLPIEVLAEHLPSSALLGISACCHALRAATLEDDVWRVVLMRERGFTTAGIDAWQRGGGVVRGVCGRIRYPSWFPHTLLACWHYCTFLHEVLEIELYRPPLRALDGPASSPQLYDMRLCLELANGFPMPTWVFFMPVATCDAADRPPAESAPWETPSTAPVTASSGSVASASAAVAVAGGMLTLHTNACNPRGTAAFGSIVAIGMRASQPGSQTPLKTAVLLSFGCSQHADGTKAIDGAAEANMRQVPLGWHPMPGIARDGAIRAVQALLLPPCASGDRLVVLGEHTLRLPAAVADAAASEGCFYIAVLHAAHVWREGAPVELAAELDHDVMTSAGAMADPTRPNHKSAQRPFDWSAREQPDGTWAAQTGLEDEDEVYVERLGRAVPTAPRPTPNQKVWTLREAPTRLSYVALRRTYVRVSWQPE